MRKHYYFILALLLSIACASSNNPAHSKNSATLSSIARKPALFDGKEVQLEGNYLGWKHGECRFPKSFSSKQITRSDWVFSDGKRCCFVTGSVPKGLDPASSEPVPVKLTALVKQEDSKIYLELVNVLVK